MLASVGNSHGVSSLTASAIASSYLLPKKENDVTILDSFLVLLKVLREPTDIYNFSFVVGLLTVSSYLDIYSDMFLGLVLTMFAPKEEEGSPASSTAEADPPDGVHLPDDWQTNFYCGHLANCSSTPARATSAAKEALIFGLLAINLLKNFLYVWNVWVHQNACDKKNSAMRARCFAHLLTLDQAFFDTKSMSEIRGSMNCEAINNLISWNVPYLLTRIFKLLFSFYFMFSISTPMACIAVFSMVVIKYGLLEPLAHHELNVGKIRK